MLSQAPRTPMLAPEPPRRPRGAKVLAIVGAVVLVLSAVAVVAGVGLIGDSADDFGASTSATRSSLLGEFELPGEVEVTLTPGRYYVYAIEPVDDLPLETTTSILRDGGSGTDPDPGTGATRTRQRLDVAVTVTGPDGREVSTDLPGPGALFHGLADGLQVVAQFRVTETGSHVVAGTGADAPRAGVGRSTDLGRAVGEALGGGLLTVVGGFGALLGGALLLAGLVWFLASKPGSPTPPPGYGYGSPPPGAWSPPGPGGPGGWAPPAGSRAPTWTAPPAPPPPPAEPPPEQRGPVS